MDTTFQDYLLRTEKKDIAELFRMALERYQQLYPEWEITVISWERNADRNRQIDDMIRYLERRKTDQE